MNYLTNVQSTIINSVFHLILLFLQHRYLTTELIPFEVAGLAVLICNSNVKHELSSSEYPVRRKQCQQALELMGLKSYRDATEKSLEGT